ncbi:unnamed protein product [Urochloa humidicola]
MGRKAKKIRICGEAALPSDAEIAREKEEVQGEDALCEPRIRKEVTDHDPNAASEVSSETFSKEEEKEAEEGEEAVSFAPSSPLCEPRIEQEVIGHDSNGVAIYKPIDSETFRVYRQCEARFQEKLARTMKLPTLDESISGSPPDDAELHMHHGRQSATKAARNFVVMDELGEEEELLAR